MLFNHILKDVDFFNLKMDSLKEIVEGIPIEDLEDKELCIRCVNEGLFEMYDPYDEMQEGISTSDKICNHCHDTEADFGYEKMTKEEIKRVGKIMDEFIKIKEPNILTSSNINYKYNIHYDKKKDKYS